MKKFAALIGMLLSVQAMAGQPSLTQSSGIAGMANDYHFGMPLDVARVLSHTEIPAVCHVVPVEMIYEDSQGDEHSVRYRVMGSGCLNG